MRILLSLAPPDGTTRFVDQLVAEPGDTVEYIYFSWLTAIFGRYDVFHVHWPEFLLRSDKLYVRAIKAVLFNLFMARLALTKTAVVRTLHNLRPHEEGSKTESRLLMKCDALTTLDIRLNEETMARGKPLVTILHGHYKSRFPARSPVSRVPGRILYFGLIRPYKGVERLIEVFSALEDKSLSLRIVGNPTPELRTAVLDSCEKFSQITCDLRFVPDDVLADEIRQAELVVLPYREMHNSGAVLVALSLSRRVLVPKSKSNELLSAEVGQGWIEMFDGELTEDVLQSAHQASARATDTESAPLLSKRDWSEVGRQHAVAYADSIRLKDQS